MLDMENLLLPLLGAYYAESVYYPHLGTNRRASLPSQMLKQPTIYQGHSQDRGRLPINLFSLPAGYDCDEGCNGVIVP